MRLILILFILLVARQCSTLAYASPQIGIPAKPHIDTSQTARYNAIKRKKIKTNKTVYITKTDKEWLIHNSNAVKKYRYIRSDGQHNVTAFTNVVFDNHDEQLTSRYLRKQHEATTDLVFSPQTGLSLMHQMRYQYARQTAIHKLMEQMGKPYRWGGESPDTGFDCSGLIYYAYKDVVKIKMPRTANEMYHLRSAAKIKKTELKRGDLVFFRINNRRATDHVGVYLGDGQFIQAPRTGKNIRISQLNNDYWQNRYVGARRIVTQKNIH